MRITQGYVSKSVMDFPFHQIYRLDDYMDNYLPSVFFGMYRYEDEVLMFAHHKPALIFWTGQDALNFKYWRSLDDMKIHGVTSVTAHPKVHKLITDKGCECQLVKPSTFLCIQQPQRLGKKIYAYCPSSVPDYHGIKIIEELRRGGYEIIIGDGQFTQDQWRLGHADFHYSQCFIGLCLSEFAGGGTSIIEMGLRGMRVVTNVFDLPNCIPWNSLHDVMLAIELESKKVGTINRDLSNQVWQSLDHNHEWLNI